MATLLYFYIYQVLNNMNVLEEEAHLGDASPTMYVYALYTKYM